MFIIQEIVGPIIDWFDNSTRLGLILAGTFVAVPMALIAGGIFLS